MAEQEDKVGWRKRFCRPTTCCFCFPITATSCNWIATVGLVWGSIATLVDFITAYLPVQPCTNCLNHDLDTRLCLAGGAVNALQLLASALLLVAIKKEVSVLLMVWVCCGVVGVVMQTVWLVATMPYAPSLRGLVAFLQLAWGLHYIIVVRTYYKMMRAGMDWSLDTTPLDMLAPPNSPVRRHRRRKRRVDKSTQPPIRTLVGAAVVLNHAQQQVKEKEERERRRRSKGVSVGKGRIERWRGWAEDQEERGIEMVERGDESGGVEIERGDERRDREEEERGRAEIDKEWEKEIEGRERDVGNIVVIEREDERETEGMEREGEHGRSDKEDEEEGKAKRRIEDKEDKEIKTREEEMEKDKSDDEFVSVVVT
ncbi:hypothetical protein Pmani_027928 [Petrolisthes manimaculis]|uniref:Transmembrane protein n=1 Tax=Petrolisthes manimaculis TaxID=1843537 RepID=A0AAE1P0E3_9EUCA|nr:hypothetical protein Pmani_027928 [Petrolisthes manimaculis]